MGSQRLVHREKVTDVAFSFDGRHLATCTSREELRIWDRASGAQVIDLGPEPTMQVVYHPDGKRLFTLSEGGGIFVRPADGTGKPGRFAREAGRTTAFAISADGSTLVTGGWNGEVTVWDANSGTLRCRMKAHKEYASTVAVSPDGKLAASGGDQEKALKIWDARAGKPHKVIDTFRPYGLAFSTDGKALIFPGPHCLRVCDPATGRFEERAPDDEKVGFMNLEFSAKGNRLLALAYRHDSRRTAIWEYPSFRKMRELPVGGRARFSPDGGTVAVMTNAAAPRFFDTAGGDEVLNLGHRDAVTCLRWKPGGGELASASRDRTVRTWDATSGKEKASFGFSDGQAALAHDGTMAVVVEWGYQNRDGKVFLRQVPSGRQLGELPAERWARQAFQVPGFLPGDRAVAVGHASGVILWSRAGQLIGEVELGQKNVRALGFSPDGRLMACGTTRDEVCIVDLRTLKVVQTLKVDERTSFGRFGTLSFSPDGKQLALAAEQARCSLWDLATGRKLRDLGEAVGLSATFSPDGKLLAVGRSGGRADVYGASGEKRLLAVTGHLNQVSALAFSPDCQRLASGGADGTIVVWDLEQSRRLWESTPHPADPDPGDPEPGAGPPPDPAP